MHRGPNPIHLAIDKMSHGSKADLPAIRHKEDLELDKKNGNTLWADAIAKEMKDVRVTFKNPC